MSADNTIVILKNRGRSGSYEYRVALVTAAENLFPMDSETEADWMARQWFMLHWFGSTNVYFTSRKARAKAYNRLRRMRKRCKIVEYGIQKLNREDELFPTTDKKSVEAWLRANNTFPFQTTSMMLRKSVPALPTTVKPTRS